MAMMQAQGIGQDSPINKLAMSIAQRAMLSNDPAGVLAHYKSMPDARLAAFLADGLVQTQLAAKHNQQALQQYNPNSIPVLARLEQQGVSGLSVGDHMFDPSLHQQGITGEEEGTEQAMAGGGIVAFAGRGPSRVSAEGGEPGIGMEDLIDEIVRDKKVEELRARAAAARGITPPPPVETITAEDVAVRRAIEQGKSRAAAARAPAPAAPVPAAAAPVPAAAAAAPAPAPAAAAPAPAQPAAASTAAPAQPATPAGKPAFDPRASLNAARAGAGDVAAKAVKYGGRGLGVLGVGTTAYDLASRFLDTDYGQRVLQAITPESEMERRANEAMNQQPTSEQLAAAKAIREGRTTGAVTPEQTNTLFNSLIQEESGGRQFNARNEPLTSPKGAVGIAQIMPSTGPEAAKLAGLEWDEKRFREDPAYNKALGQAYFDAQLKRFNGNVNSALAAYNAGPGVVQSYLTGKPLRLPDGRVINPDGIKTPDGVPPYPETQKYVANVTQRMLAGRPTATAAATDTPMGTAANVARFTRDAIEQGTGFRLPRSKDEVLDKIFAGREALASGIADQVGQLTGAHRTGLEPEAKPTAVAAAPTGPTAYEQYAEKRLQDAAAAGANKQELRDLGLALMMAGAKTMAGKSQYAMQNIGEGLESGVAGYVGLQQKRAEAALKAEEKEKDRAEKRFATLVKLKAQQIKNRMPEITDPEEREARAYYEVLSVMSPRDLAAQGLTKADVLQAKQALSTGKEPKADSRFTVREKS